MEVDERKVIHSLTLRPDWHNYSKEGLNHELGKLRFEEEIYDIQDFWNSIEQTLLVATDIVHPIVEFTEIDYDWLNQSFYSYKVKCKSLYLP